MATDNLEILKQLVDALEKAEAKLEKSYKKEKHEEFKQTKKYILETQSKISELIKR